MDELNNTDCHNQPTINTGAHMWISAVMFGLGFFGNVAALLILEIQRRRDSRNKDMKPSGLFHIFILSLVVTDLTGTCLTSPVVLLSHAMNTTLVEMIPNCEVVCKYFGFNMTFFSLITLSLLLSTALDRCFAIGYPYLYCQHVTKKWAYVTIAVMFFISIMLSLLPFVGFGRYVQYCPGTWCFIDMNPPDKEDRAYANLFATVMLVLVLTNVVCHGFVVYHLYKMYQRRNRRGSVIATMRSSSKRRMMSMAVEVEHLILLIVMTIIFLICTLPLVFRVYINSTTTHENHPMDLVALRFISFTSIIDPWVFIFLSPGVLNFFWVSFCNAPLGRFSSSACKTSQAKDDHRSHLQTTYTEDKV
nr:prostaglandin E receptor 2a (subtype EP2) [Nothobranchius furzeri]